MAENKPKKGKKIKGYIKLAIRGGGATPAQPVGPALGQHGIPIMDFCKEFNARTAQQSEDIIPVVITVFEDRSFTFVTKSPLTSHLLKRAVKVEKGSGVPNKQKIGTITMEQLQEIAKVKMRDLNAKELDQAVKVIAGTARSMGIEVK